MNFEPVDLHPQVNFLNLTIDPDLKKSHFANILKEFAIVSFSAFYNRGQYGDGFLLK